MYVDEQDGTGVVGRGGIRGRIPISLLMMCLGTICSSIYSARPGRQILAPHFYFFFSGGGGGASSETRHSHHLFFS